MTVIIFIGAFFLFGWPLFLGLIINSIIAIMSRFLRFVDTIVVVVIIVIVYLRVLSFLPCGIVYRL